MQYDSKPQSPATFPEGEGLLRAEGAGQPLPEGGLSLDDGVLPEGGLRPERRPPPDEGSHGDRVARLFREHNDSLVRALRARLSSPQEAKEVAQEAYVRLLRLDNPGGVSLLQAYLFKTAINLAKDRLKHKARKASLEPLMFFDAEVEAVSPPPDQGICAQQELALIRRAVEELPAKCRYAFILHKLHELSIEETANRMNLNPRVVRRYVARAIAHCQMAVEGQWSDTGREHSTGRNHDED